MKKILFAIIIVLTSFRTFAEVIHVSPSESLQAVIDAAQAGDTLELAAGKYIGKIVINKSLILQGQGEHAAIIEGDRIGRTISVAAPDVTIKNLTVTRSGLSLPDMDAGIFLDKTALRAQILNNHILENSVGVYLWGANNCV